MSADCRLGVPEIERTDLANGGIALRNAVGLPDPLPDVLERFDYWVTLDPESVLLTDRHEGEIRTLSYGAAAAQSDLAASRLSGFGVAQGGVVAVIGGAGVEHAILKIACLKLGAVLTSLSPILIASASGQRRLAAMLAVAKPKIMVAYAADKERVAQATPKPAPRLVGFDELIGRAGDGQPSGGGRRKYSPRRFAPSDAAAIFFTSGSTGEPKGVSVTRGMIASNQSACGLHWPFLAWRRPVLIDWLPWHHVFGGLDNFFKMLWYGGEYHVDAPPDPANGEAMAERIRALRPSLHINVPYGIGLLLDRLDADTAASKAFFSRMELIFFAGAGMDGPTWSRLQSTVAQAPAGAHGPPTVLSGYGATEAASTICLGHEAAGRPGEIGLPIPGHELRLVPLDDGFELRVRGPNVAPAYLAADGCREMTCDEEGYLCTGDVVVAVHKGEPERGLRFDGRIAEDFKLTNGTRVKVGALRHSLLEACAPHLADVAIAGEGQDYVSAVLFAAETADESMTARELAAHFEQALSRHNALSPGSSTAIRRAVVAGEPPDPDAGEINDKGHLVQRRCLRNRRDLVRQLYDDPPTEGVLLPDHPDSPAQRSTSHA